MDGVTKCTHGLGYMEVTECAHTGICGGDNVHTRGYVEVTKRTRGLRYVEVTMCTYGREKMEVTMRTHIHGDIWR